MPSMGLKTINFEENTLTSICDLWQQGFILAHQELF